MTWQLVVLLVAFFVLTVFLTVNVKLSILNGKRPKFPEPRAAATPVNVAARLAIVRDLAPAYGGEGYLANVLDCSKDEPAIISGYGDGGRRRLTLQTFGTLGTYYAIETPGKPVTEIFICNDGGRMPVTGGRVFPSKDGAA